MTQASDLFFTGQADSDYYQRQSAFLGKIIIKVYVEAIDDVALWEKAFTDANQVTQLNLELDLSPIGDFTGSDGKGDVLQQIETAGPHLLLCVDSDDDFIAKNHRPLSTLINDNEFVLQTYCYALENFVCEPSQLPTLLTKASGRQALSNELCIAQTLKQIGDCVYEPLTMILYLLQQGHADKAISDYKTRIIQSLCFIGQTNKFDQRLQQIEQDMTALKDELTPLFTTEQSHGFASWKSEIDTFFEGHWHLIIRGHDLLDKVVLPLAKHICRNRVTTKNQELNARSGEDKEQKLVQYNKDLKVAPELLIKNRVDFEKTCIYRHILNDFTQIFQKHHA